MLLSPYRLTVLLYRPTEGGRLSRPRHYSKCAQPVPKAVYCSGCRDKHIRPRCDSNLGPLTPQSDALTTRPLHLSNVPFPSLERAHRRDMYWTPNLVTDAPCSCIPPHTISSTHRASCRCDADKGCHYSINLLAFTSTARPHAERLHGTSCHVLRLCSHDR